MKKLELCPGCWDQHSTRDRLRRQSLTGAKSENHPSSPAHIAWRVMWKQCSGHREVAATVEPQLERAELGSGTSCKLADGTRNNWDQTTENALQELLVKAASCRNGRAHTKHEVRMRHWDKFPAQHALFSQTDVQKPKPETEGWRSSGLDKRHNCPSSYHPHHQLTQGCCCLLPIATLTAPFSCRHLEFVAIVGRRVGQGV